jgi:hypothetical protein
MKLGEFFTYEELTRTDQPFSNEPELFQVVNLARLCCMALDPLRRLSGEIKVNSGFRSQKVNDAVGGSPASYHMQGLAADIRSDTHSPGDLLKMLGGLEYDKAIDEFDQWLHIQIAPIGTPPRGELLKARKVRGETQFTEVFL